MPDQAKLPKEGRLTLKEKDVEDSEEFVRPRHRDCVHEAQVAAEKTVKS